MHAAIFLQPGDVDVCQVTAHNHRRVNFLPSLALKRVLCVRAFLSLFWVGVLMFRAFMSLFWAGVLVFRAFLSLFWVGVFKSRASLQLL